jgi:pyruvate kinase
MTPKKSTKIVATIGPASESREVLKEMIRAGLNVCRLNFSHNVHEWHQSMIATIRALSSELDKPVGILGDLQGPRIRTTVEGEVEVEVGQTVAFVERKDVESAPSATPAETTIGIDCPNIIEKMSVGNKILIEDGTKKFEVLETKDGYVTARVLSGGVIHNHKGVNLPEVDVPLPILTEKDEKDLAFLVKQKVDFIALSFVRSAEEILMVKAKIRELNGGEDGPKVISKIERKEAIESIEEIVKATDGVMVARGDLGIEMDESKVVIYQKKIIKECLLYAKPVIVATQMLASMEHNALPTRAEVSDVTNAVIDHTDAVMLSGESAMGKYPLEAVSIMSEIARNTEESPFDDIPTALDVICEGQEQADVLRGVYELSKGSGIKAVLLFSRQGFTAQLISHFRPKVPIYVATDNERVYYQMALLWGVKSFYAKGEMTPRERVDAMIADVKKDGWLEKGDRVVVVLGRAEEEGGEMQLVGVREIQ